MKIISGGQTGVDRGALDAAIALGIDHAGWCPRGRRAEDGRIPDRYRLRQTDTPQYPERTERNVVDSHATLILYRGTLSGGTELTRRLAEQHDRPYLAIDLDESRSAEEVRRWLEEHDVSTLNVAGPRESQCRGIAEDSRQFIEQVLAAHEDDYRPVADTDRPTRLLPDTRIEIVCELDRTAPPEHVLFDFDGTLSLIREGWPEVMVPMMVDVLAETGTDESPEELERLTLDFVMQLNGKQTIYQMIRLAEEVRRRGGTPQQPQAYKDRYHELLLERIEGRRALLRSGRTQAEGMLVPYALDLLAELKRRGLALYLASGTDERYVREEVALLGLGEFFGPRVYGAQDDYRNFSKAMVIERILTENRVEGTSLLGFGDGYVEIQNIKTAGGTAVAVASDESGRSGNPNEWKRRRLIGVGADMVIPDYREWEALLGYVLGEK